MECSPCYRICAPHAPQPPENCSKKRNFWVFTRHNSTTTQHYLPNGLVFAVDGSKLTFVGSRQDLLIEDFSFGVSTLLQIAAGQIILCLGHVGIIGTQLWFVDVESSLVVLLNLVVFALILAEQGEIVKLLGNIGMILSQDLLSDLQGTLAQWLGIFVLATFAIEDGQVVQRGRHGWMVLAQCLSSNRQSVVE